MGAESVAERLADLRGEFDRSFTAPLRRHDTEYVELLSIRAGERPYALRLAETSGVYPDRPVTRIPGPLPALLGVAGYSGTILPVYDLAALLGHPGPDRPRWMVLAAGSPALAFAFHGLDGHIRVPAAAIVTETEAGADGVRGMVRLPGGTRPIIDLPATRAAVHRLAGRPEAGPPPPDEERT